MPVIKINQILAGCDTITTFCRPVAVKLANGNILAVYEAKGSDLYDSVYARTLDTNGSPLDAEFMVNSAATESQHDPVAIALKDGTVTALWLGYTRGSSGYGTVIGQNFTSYGAKTPAGFTFPSSRAGNFISASTLYSGAYVISYTSSFNSENWGPYFQILSGTNDVIKEPTKVTMSWVWDSYSISTILSDGGFVIGWEDMHGSDGSGNGAYIKIYDDSGSAVTDELLVNSVSSQSFFRSLHGLANGGFIAIWANAEAYTEYGLYGQKFDAHGNKVGNTFSIDTQGPSYQDVSSVIPLSDGGFIVVWHGNGETASGYEIYAKRFDANGNPIDKVAKISENQQGDQKNPSGVVTSRVTSGNQTYDKVLILWRNLDPTNLSVQGTVIYTNTSLAETSDIFSPYITQNYTSVFKINHLLAWCVSSSIKTCRPAIIELGSGAFVEFYTAKNSDSYEQMYGRVLDVRDHTISREMQINENTDYAQHDPIAITLSNGDVVLLWIQDTIQSYSIAMGQRFSNNGEKIGTNFAIPSSVGDSTLLSACPLEDSDYVVSFTVNSKLYVQPMSSYDNPVGEGILVTLNGSQYYPSVLKLKSGEFVVNWSGSSDGSGYDVFMKLYSDHWVAITQDIQVNTYTTSNQYLSTLKALQDGFITVWQSKGQNGPDHKIYAQKFDDHGNKVGSEFNIDGRTGNQVDSNIVSLPDDTFLVFWQGNGDPALGYEVYGRRFLEDGRSMGGAFKINTPSPSDQIDPYGLLVNYTKGIESMIFVSWLDNSASPSIEGKFLTFQYPTKTHTSSVTLTPTHLAATPVDFPVPLPLEAPVGGRPSVAPLNHPAPISLPSLAPSTDAPIGFPESPAPVLSPELVPLHPPYNSSPYEDGGHSNVVGIAVGACAGAVGLIAAAVGSFVLYNKLSRPLLAGDRIGSDTLLDHPMVP